MEGIQKTIHLALTKLASDVQNGRYGRDDDFDDEAFAEDVMDDVVRVSQ